jgi:hypothetical protein
MYISFEIKNNFLFRFEQFLSSLIILDSVIQCNLSYYKEGIFVTSRTKIIKKYFKSKFAIDIVTVFSLLIGHNYQLFSLLRAFKVPDILSSID